jgi:GntR family transcriptional regulator, transcriptional repressor for pyruvate dehydrogenase complex
MQAKEPMEAIKKTSLSEAVAQSLLSLISKGELDAEGKLPSESQLCAMLGVSRTAVREGIKALAGINILTVFPGRGTFVNKDQNIMVSDEAINIALDRETVNAIYEVRSVLDAGLAKYAALKATEDDLIALRNAVSKMEKTLESEPVDFESATEGDDEFHSALCKAAHNTLLENIARPVINHVALRVRRQMVNSFDKVRTAAEGHREILQGIEKRDAKSAVKAVEKHLKIAFDIIYGNERDVLPQQREQL